MNKNFPLVALLIVFSFSSGCNGLIKNIEPSDDLPLDEAFNSAGDLENALTGLYDAFQGTDLSGRNLLYISDLMGRNGIHTGGVNDFIEIGALQISPLNRYVEQIWTRAYQAINQANAVLEAIDRVAAEDATLSAAAAGRIEGEALFFRGLLYFELIRLYALPFGETSATDPGVPLMLDPVLGRETLSFPTRASVQEVYEQLGSDLALAYELLPEEHPQGRGRADRYVALAYLTRVAFQRGDYAAAAQYCNTLINAGKYQLTSTPQEFFTNEGSSEEIWAVINQVDDPVFGGLPWAYNERSGRNTVIAPELKEDSFQKVLTMAQQTALNDLGLRAIDLRTDTGTLAAHPLVTADTSQSFKYEDAENLADDAPMARLAEFLLIRAEALVRVSETIEQESIDLLNAIRARALRVIDETGNEVDKNEVLFAVGDFPDPTALLEAIIRERRVELAFEGNYFHDLIRQGERIQGFPSDADNLRLPIPQRELDANPNLVQNPGY